MHRALSRQDEERTFGRQFNEIAQQNQETIQRAGVHPLRIFSDFLGIMKVLGGNDPASKAALLRDVALRNGLDMRSLLGMPQSGQQPNPSAQPGSPPPVVIPPELQQVATEWNQFKAQQQRDKQEAAAREEQKTLDEIVAFRGQPNRQYFDAVKDQMVAFLQSGAAATLEEAYDQAIWARPDIRTELIKQQSVHAQQDAVKRQRAQLARAKGGSVRGAGGSAPASTPEARSLRQELEAGFAEARGRV